MRVKGQANVFVVFCFWLLTVLGSTPTTAGPAVLSVAKSSLAVVTEREGLASGLAHRHIVVARDWNANLNLVANSDAAQVSSLPWISGTADIELPVKKLLVDDNDAAKSILSVLVAHDVWSEEKDHLEPSNQAKVTENMLADDQLNVEAFPKITGSGTFDGCQKGSTQTEVCRLRLILVIRGKSVEKQTEVTLKSEAGETTASFVLPFKFTEFGITPYSTMMGAIRVSDEFKLAGILRADAK